MKSEKIEHTLRSLVYPPVFDWLRDHLVYRNHHAKKLYKGHFPLASIRKSNDTSLNLTRHRIPPTPSLTRHENWLGNCFTNASVRPSAIS